MGCKTNDGGISMGSETINPVYLQYSGYALFIATDETKYIYNIIPEMFVWSWKVVSK